MSHARESVDTEPGDKESFDTFLDHTDELEKKYAISLNTNNRKVIYKAVIDELKERNLVNKAFYENQVETISLLDGEMDEFKDIVYTFLNAFIFIFFYGILCIIVLRQLPLILLSNPSFVNTLWGGLGYK